jgi:hypothetical protein
MYHYTCAVAAPSLFQNVVAELNADFKAKKEVVEEVKKKLEKLMVGEQV